MKHTHHVMAALRGAAIQGNFFDLSGILMAGSSPAMEW